MSGFAFHAGALADLREISGYVAADNPDAAERLVAEIYAAVQGLVAFPNQGHTRRDLTL